MYGYICLQYISNGQLFVFSELEEKTNEVGLVTDTGKTKAMIQKMDNGKKDKILK